MTIGRFTIYDWCSSIVNRKSNNSICNRKSSNRKYKSRNPFIGGSGFFLASPVTSGLLTFSAVKLLFLTINIYIISDIQIECSQKLLSVRKQEILDELRFRAFYIQHNKSFYLQGKNIFIYSHRFLPLQYIHKTILLFP